MRFFGTVAAAVVAAACLSVSSVQPASAEAAVELTGSAGPFFQQRAKVAVPAYHVVFITQQEGTAAGSMEARARLNTRLVGVDEATMRRLANEAHADFVAQLQGAGIEVVPAEQNATIAADVEKVPGNGDVRDAGRGITIGRAVRRGYAAFGADAAPLLAPYHNPTSPNGTPNMIQIPGASNKLGRAARVFDAVAVVPALTFDYVSMELTARSDAANVSANLGFALRASSNVAFAGQGNAGPGYYQGMRMREDYTVPTSFIADVATGGADVNVGTLTAQADENYVMQDRARGDAVYVNLPVWEGLVRDAYKTFNAAVVAEIVEARS
ncbi:MAG: hypothetical protein WDM79_06925 [Terricaulis sp.]